MVGFAPIIIFCFIHSCSGILKKTMVNHTDPYYMDTCLEKTGELCEYCCLDDFEWCSQDTYFCDPITDRDMTLMWQAGLILGSIICGFPIAVILFRQLMIRRCCIRWFPATGGVTCVELSCRSCLCLFCCRKFNQTYKRAPEGEE